MPEAQRAIIAGSAGFVQTVQAQLQLRLGAVPGVASDPAEALRAGESAKLVVVECAGALWVDAVRALRERAAPGALSIVAAVPPGSAAEVLPLKSAGADEVVAWQGRADPVVWAVDRVVARARAAAAPPSIRATPARAVAPVAAAAAVPASSPASAPAAAAPSTPQPPPAAPSSVAPAAEPFDVLEVVGECAAVGWPNAVPSPAEAESLLAAAVVGQLPAVVAHGAEAARVALALTVTERSALKGAALAGAAAVRAAAGQRLRLSIALASVPATREGADVGVAQRLLAEVDGALAAVSALAADAPPDQARDLAALRHALVDGGVHLSEVVSSFAETEASPRPEQPAVAPRARVLSDEPDAPQGARGPRWAMWLVLGVSVALTLAYHGVLSRPRTSAVRPIAGAPANTLSMERGGTRLLLAAPGKTVDAAELDAFRAQQLAKGFVVREATPGTWLIEPATRTPGGQP